MAGLLLVCGSVRAGSTNAAVLRTAGLLAPDGVAVSDYDELAVLPHFNPDHDGDNGGERLPDAAARLRRRLGEADALLFSTPEYAGARIVEAACVQVPVTRDDLGPDGLVSDPGARDRLAAAVAALVTAARG